MLGAIKNFNFINNDCLLITYPTIYEISNSYILYLFNLIINKIRSNGVIIVDLGRASH